MIFAEASQQEWVAATEQLDLAGSFDIMGEGEPRSQCPQNGLPSNALEIRHPECNRCKLDSVDGYLYSSASGGRQHAAIQPFRPLA